MNNFSLNFRKILPFENNAASNLNQSANDRRARRIHVNAQVTAMATIIEFLYITLYSVVVGYISKGSSFATLIQVMGLYCVVLPYFFLMNTSHNKNRIIDIGWQNVFQNMVRGLVSTSNDNNTTLNRGIDNLKNSVETQNELPKLDQTTEDLVLRV